MPGAGVTGAGCAVAGLLTCGVENPAAVDAQRVHFTWQCRADAPDVRQTACRITVRDASDGRVMWDSGRMETDVSAAVPYGGLPLAGGRRYVWSVCIRDSRGGFATGSARFCTCPGAGDWTAAPIWDGTETENSFVYFGAEFRLRSAEVRSAMLFAFAHNDCQLFLDGAFLGAGPARANPYRSGQVFAFDVADALAAKQDHTLAALVHWHGAWGTGRGDPVDEEPQRTWGDSGVNARPAFLLELRIEYADGSRQTVATDESWKTCRAAPLETDAPVWFGGAGGRHNRASVRYDARRELPEWPQGPFSGARWRRASAQEGLHYRLCAQLVEPQREHGRTHPERVWKEEEAWCAKFDCCRTGWPCVRFPGAARGDVIRIFYREVGGRREGPEGAGYDVYIAKGANDCFYVPYVRHTSFRMLVIKGYRGCLCAEDVEAVTAYSLAPKRGSFLCSDGFINRVYAMCERSARQNVQQGVVSVDANREQSQWLADSWNVGMGLLYSARNTRVLCKILADYAAEQRAGGMFYSCSPGAIYELREWAFYFAMLLWEAYLASGDRAMLRMYFENVRRFLDTEVPRWMDSDGLCNPGGWRASDYPDLGTPEQLKSGGANIAVNSMCYGNLMLAAQMARELGDRALAAQYLLRARRLRRAIFASLTRSGRFLTKTDDAQVHPLGAAWAVRFGVERPSRHPALRAYFSACAAKGFVVGGYGGCTLYEALYRLGMGETVCADMRRYREMLAANNTNWESFGELGPDNMGNHAWTSYPAYLLPRYAAGVRPLAAGYAVAEIAPVMAGLEWARADVPTVKGTVHVHWRKQGKSGALLARLPANMCGVLRLPRAPFLSLDGCAVGGRTAKIGSGEHILRFGERREAESIRL